MISLLIGSTKGSPGATTTALALAAAWPLSATGQASPPVVAELDPAGGDLAARFGLTGPPDLVSLAAAARRGTLMPSTVIQHCQQLPGGLPVLLGPVSADQARFALELLDPAQLVRACDRAAGVDLVIDAGRLDPGTPLLTAIEAVGLTLVVVRPVTADVLHLADRLDALRAAARALAVVVVGNGPYPAKEVAEALGVEVAGALPHDPRAAAMLGGSVGSRRALYRSSLVRAACSLAEALVVTRRRHPAAASTPLQVTEAMS